MSLSEALDEPKAKAAHVWQRDSLDWYVEPVRATEALLTVEGFSGRIHDPACGQGNIVRALRDAGHSATGSDIKRRVADGTLWFTGEHDFLTMDMPSNQPPNLVFNPPFYRAKGAEAFIRRALLIATGKICVFLDIRFLAGAGRAFGLFAEHPPCRVWILAPRPSCPPGEYLLAGGRAKEGTSDWCWLVWDRTSPPAPTMMGWIRCPNDKAPR